MSRRKHRLSPHFVGVCTHSLKSGHSTAERVGPCDVYSARDAVHVCFGAIGWLLVKGITCHFHRLRFSLLRSEVKAAGMHPIDVCQLAVTNTKSQKRKGQIVCVFGCTVGSLMSLLAAVQAEFQ